MTAGARDARIEMRAAAIAADRMSFVLAVRNPLRPPKTMYRMFKMTQSELDGYMVGRFESRNMQQAWLRRTRVSDGWLAGWLAAIIIYERLQPAA